MHDDAQIKNHPTAKQVHSPNLSPSLRPNNTAIDSANHNS